jgi:hypothetical protein
MKRRSPKITATVYNVDQEVPPDLWDRALEIYAQWAIDAYFRKQNAKIAEHAPVPVERIEGDVEDW